MRVGGCGVPPSVMLKIVLFAYSRRVVSSGRIDNRCETNINFMRLSGDVEPHSTSIAHFVTHFITSTKMKIEPLFIKWQMYCLIQNIISLIRFINPFRNQFTPNYY